MSGEHIMWVADLPIPCATKNALLNGNIGSVEILLTKSRDDLRKIKNLGPVGVRHIETALSVLGLRIQSSDTRLDESLRLIAAAPDLLAACEEAIRTCNDDVSDEECLQAERLVRAAIAKARGTE